jgi:hypothetical protein
MQCEQYGILVVAGLQVYEGIKPDFR